MEDCILSWAHIYIIIQFNYLGDLINVEYGICKLAFFLELCLPEELVWT